MRAHSHIFVDARTGFASTEEGQLRALKITWTYDAFTMLCLFDVHNLDKDGDDSLDIADRNAIVIAETAEWPPGYTVAVHLEFAGILCRSWTEMGRRAGEIVPGCGL